MNELFTKNPIVGAPLTPSLMRAMNSAIRRNRPIAGKGVRISYTVGGAIISAQPSSGGIGAANILFPFKCEPYDHFPEETPEEKAEREAKGEPLKPDFEGYRFFLPKYSLMYNGKEIEFKNDEADYRETGSSFTDGAWKVWKGIDKDARGTVFCRVKRGKACGDTKETLFGEMYLKAKEDGSESGGDCDCSCSCSCSCSEDDGSVIVNFPVCEVDKWANGTSESEHTDEKAERIIEQYVFGEVIIENSGGGCWDISGGEFVNRYVWNGSQMLEGNKVTTEGFAGKIAAIVLDNVDATVTVSAFDDVDALNEFAKIAEYVVIPLYRFNDKGRPEVDFRNIPMGDSWAMLV